MSTSSYSDPIITPVDLPSLRTELRSLDQGQMSRLQELASTCLGKCQWCWLRGLQLMAHWHNRSAVKHIQLYDITTRQAQIQYPIPVPSLEVLQHVIFHNLYYRQFFASSLWTCNLCAVLLKEFQQFLKVAKQYIFSAS